MRAITANCVLALALSNVLAVSAMAQKLNQKHPGYLAALADLRQARYYLNKQEGGPKLKGEEAAGTREIDAAVAEIKKAQIDDGKAVTDAAVDANEHGSPLAKAIETIYKASEDIQHEEDNVEARELRKSTLAHLSSAVESAKQAHAEWLAEMKTDNAKDAPKH